MSSRGSRPALPGPWALWASGATGFIGLGAYWVAVKELKLSYYIGETLLFTMYIYIYTHYGNLI